MVTAGDASGTKTRASQDETSPIPLEFVVVSRKKRVSQDETSPIPLEFQVISRPPQPSQDETSPIPLEFRVVLPDGDTALARVGRAPGSQGQAPPRLKWRGLDASAEFHEYAARIAAGEDLPPYRGPILASGEFSLNAPPVSSRASTPHAVPTDAVPTHAVPGTASASNASALKVLLGLVLISSALVASVMLGDDAQLRAAGQSVSRWFSGSDRSFEMAPPAPASNPAVPCETGASAPKR